MGKAVIVVELAQMTFRQLLRGDYVAADSGVACVTQGAPPGSASFMITCSHTATLGADWLFFGLAVGCIMI